MARDLAIEVQVLHSGKVAFWEVAICGGGWVRQGGRTGRDRRSGHEVHGARRVLELGGGKESAKLCPVRNSKPGAKLFAHHDLPQHCCGEASSQSGKWRTRSVPSPIPVTSHAVSRRCSHCGRERLVSTHQRSVSCTANLFANSGLFRYRASGLRATILRAFVGFSQSRSKSCGSSSAIVRNVACHWWGFRRRLRKMLSIAYPETRSNSLPVTMVDRTVGAQACALTSENSPN